MLKKVSAAISKYVSPIASSGKADSSIVKDKPKTRDFKKFKVIINEEHPENQKRDQEASPEQQNETEEPKEQQDAGEKSSGFQGLGGRFINLLQKIQSKQSKINESKGKREYAEIEQKKQKKLKVRKGAMLNENVE